MISALRCIALLKLMSADGGVPASGSEGLVLRYYRTWMMLERRRVGESRISMDGWYKTCGLPWKLDGKPVPSQPTLAEFTAGMMLDDPEFEAGFIRYFGANNVIAEMQAMGQDLSRIRKAIRFVLDKEANAELYVPPNARAAGNAYRLPQTLRFESSLGGVA